MPPIFALLQERGGIDEAEMFRAFNMGIGLVVIVAPEHLARAVALLGAGEPSRRSAAS